MEDSSTSDLNVASTADTWMGKTATHEPTDYQPETDLSLLLTRIAVLLVGVVGLLDNGVALFAIKSVAAVRKRLGNLYVIHQCVVDLLCSLSLMMHYLFFLISPQLEGYQGVVLCKIMGSEALMWTAWGVSTFNLILVNVDRYICIVFPNQYKFVSSNRVKWGCIATAWLVAVGIFPTVQVLTTDIVDGVCYINAVWPSPKLSQIWGIVYFVSAIPIPLGIFAVCYVHIYRIVQKSRMAVESSRGAENREGERAPAKSKQNRNLSKGEKEVIKTLVFVCVVYGICVTPVNILYLLYTVGYEVDFSGSLYYLVLILLMSNCCTNPVVYLAKLKEFRQAVRDMVRCVPPDQSQTSGLSTSLNQSVSLA